MVFAGVADSTGTVISGDTLVSQFKSATIRYIYESNSSRETTRKEAARMMLTRFDLVRPNLVCVLVCS